jgi:co-chaperonin GroES (HSP10)
MAVQTQLRPYGWRVVVLPPPSDERTHRGIFLPQGTAPPLQRGVVQAVPDGGGALSPAWRLPSPGDVIHYVKGSQIGDVIVVMTDDIVAVEEIDG